MVTDQNGIICIAYGKNIHQVILGYLKTHGWTGGKASAVTHPLIHSVQKNAYKLSYYSSSKYIL
jgi:hypothetical protein